MNSIKKSQKKIIFVCLRLANGGSERVLSLLANELAKRGYDVEFIILLKSTSDYKLVSQIKVKYLNWTDDKTILYAYKKWRSLRVQLLVPNSVIIVFLFRAIFWVAICTMFSKNKIIFSERNDPRKDPSTYLKRLLRDICYMKANSIVFQNGTQRDLYYRWAQNKGIIIPNPLMEHLPEHDINKCDNIVISVCRYEEQKNIRMAIKAFSVFAKNHEQFEYHIYGRGSLEQSLREYIKELGVQNTVKLKGYAEDVHMKMKNAMIFVSSSDYEGMSNAILEAMAIGLPVICTNCPIGVNAEIISNGINGVLIDVGDSIELADRLSELADDKELREMLSKNASVIRKSNSVSHIVDQWEKVIFN